MTKYDYQLIIIFQENGKYMFEFGIEEIAKLFIINPSHPPGINTIEKDRIFKIENKYYMVENLAFDFYIKQQNSSFDGRLNVNVKLLPNHFDIQDESAIIVPAELIRKQQ